MVEQDERDEGARMVLNFGHTMGHAVERKYHYEKYTHGEGVALGMVRITQNSERLGLTEPGTARRLETLLQKVPLATRDSISLEDILTGVTMDKKKRGNTLTLVLVPKIGTSLLKKVELGQLANYFRGEA